MKIEGVSMGGPGLFLFRGDHAYSVRSTISKTLLPFESSYNTIPLQGSEAAARSRL